jgi:hypothetical protein
VRPRRRPTRREKDARRQQRPKRRPVRIRTGCAPFAFTQTYGAWGPALAYGETVTVAYEASRCTRRSGTAAELTLKGSAAVYRGGVAEGKPIEVRPFSATGMWDRPTNPSGWPPEWWACDVKNARYTWVIDGIYSFRVVARWGVWTLSVDTQGAEQRAVHWSYNGCG